LISYVESKPPVQLVVCTSPRKSYCWWV